MVDNGIFSNTMKKKQFLFSYSVFAINGMLALSIGTLLPFIRDSRGLNYAFIGLLVSLHSIGNLTSSFLGGVLPVFIGRKKSILIFNAFIAVSFALILATQSQTALAFAFFMTGLSRGATSNFCNLVINNLAPGKAWIINGLHAMFAIGAFLFPLLVTALTRSNAGNWTYAVFFMMVMGFVSWTLYLLVPLDEDKVIRKKGEKLDFTFFKEPFFYLCTATLFFYLCAEQGVIGWLVTYFIDTGLINEMLAPVMLSVLWVMILVGRLMTAWLSTRVAKEKLLMGMGIGLVVFFGVLITGRTTWQIVLGIIGFGYSMSGIYPTTVSFAGKLIQKYKLIWSFVLPLASLGSITMPLVIGSVSHSAGITYGMSTVGIAVGIALVCIILLLSYVKKHPEIL